LHVEGLRRHHLQLHLGAAIDRALCHSPPPDSLARRAPSWTSRPDDALATAGACRVTRACGGCWACGTVAVRGLRVSRYVLSCHEALGESLRDSRHVRRRARYNNSCRREGETVSVRARSAPMAFCAPKPRDAAAANRSIYRLSSRVVAMAKFRALFSCIHAWGPAPGSPVRRPGCAIAPYTLGLPQNRGRHPCPAPAQSIRLCTARCCCSAAWETLALAEGECGL
jgi:hypothetical protein